MSRSVAEQSAILHPRQAEALLRARQFGVPRSMIDAAADRRSAGDWRGACRVAGFDVRLDLGELRHRYGRAVLRALLDDLRHLAPDLLRWHLPRNLHGAGRLRAGLLIPLAEYPIDPGDGRLMLAVFTSTPALAAGERVQLVTVPLTAGGRSAYRSTDAANLRLRHADRYRLDRHRFTWDARRVGRSAGPGGLSRRPADPAITELQDRGLAELAWQEAGITMLGAVDRPTRRPLPVDRWANRLSLIPVDLPNLTIESRRLFPGAGRVALFPGGSWAIVLDGVASGSVSARCVNSASARGLPVLPSVAWSRSVDAELLRLGFISAEQLHPLVASALGVEPGSTPAGRSETLISVPCGTATHHVTYVESGWQALDHDADQLRRERRFALLGGPRYGCLDEIERMAADPGLAEEVDLYLQHGQVESARSLVRQRLGSAATLTDIGLPDGTAAIDAVDRLEQSTWRYRLALAGVPCWTCDPPLPPAGRRELSLARRRTRKGASARTNQVNP